MIINTHSNTLVWNFKVSLKWTASVLHLNLHESALAETERPTVLVESATSWKDGSGSVSITFFFWGRGVCVAEATIGCGVPGFPPAPDGAGTLM